MRFPEGPCMLPDAVGIPLAASLAVFQLVEKQRGCGGGDVRRDLGGFAAEPSCGT